MTAIGGLASPAVHVDRGGYSSGEALVTGSVWAPRSWWESPPVA